MAAEKADLASRVDIEVELAVQDFRAGQFDKAARHFDAAYQLEPTPIFIFNTGQSFRRAGRYREAILKYRLFLEKDPSLENNHRLETLGYLRELTDLMRERERPVWRKGWFWAVLGSTAVVVGASIALGATLGTQTKDEREVVPLTFGLSVRGWPR